MVSTLSSSGRYSVFLSFRGADTRKNFTDHLYSSLCNAGLRTFRDDDVQIVPELERAITESRIAVIVFSANYADSQWCLDELINIFRRKKSDDGFKVFPIFYDVEPAEVGNQKGRFKEAFDKYEGSVDLSKERIDQWREALKEVSLIAGKAMEDECTGLEAKIFIQTIVKEVGTILKRTAFSVPSYTVGIKSRVKELVNSCLKKDDDKEEEEQRFVVICGIGGIGKTTLVKLVYNMISEDFEACSFLMNIGKSCQEEPNNGLLRLQSQILSDISKRKKQKIYNLDEGIVKIHDAIYGKRILVILDDVDEIEQLDALIGASGDCLVKGSRIIITTSHERLLSHEKHKTYRIKTLDFHESLELFCLHAFLQDRPMEGYMEYSERIVRQCEGLPLALHVMGSSLFGKDSDLWASALEKLEAIPDQRIRKTLQDIDDVGEMLGKKYNTYSKLGLKEDNRLVIHHFVGNMARALVCQETIDADDHVSSCFDSTGSQSETITTQGSLLKRKRLQHDQQTTSFSLKRLCFGLLSWFHPLNRTPHRSTT